MSRLTDKSTQATKGNQPVTVTRGHGFLEKFLAKQRCSKANQLIPTSLRSGRLLDIGCGSYPYFLLNTDFQEKFGIDKSNTSGNYDNSSISDSQLEIMQWDFVNKKALPFESNFFSIVTMLAVFEHIEPTHILILVAEIHRILIQGGLFILTTPVQWTDKLLHLLARLRLVSPIEINDHKDTYTLQKITQIMEHSGFKKENIHLGYFEMYMNIWGKIEK